MLRIIPSQNGPLRWGGHRLACKVLPACLFLISFMSLKNYQNKLFSDFLSNLTPSPNCYKIKTMEYFPNISVRMCTDNVVFNGSQYHLHRCSGNFYIIDGVLRYHLHCCSGNFCIIDGVSSYLTASRAMEPTYFTSGYIDGVFLFHIDGVLRYQLLGWSGCVCCCRPAIYKTNGVSRYPLFGWYKIDGNMDSNIDGCFRYLAPGWVGGFYEFKGHKTDGVLPYPSVDSLIIYYCLAVGNTLELSVVYNHNGGLRNHGMECVPTMSLLYRTLLNVVPFLISLPITDALTVLGTCGTCEPWDYSRLRLLIRGASGRQQGYISASGSFRTKNRYQPHPHFKGVSASTVPSALPVGSTWRFLLNNSVSSLSLNGYRYGE